MTDQRGPDIATKNAEARIRATVETAPLTNEDHRAFANANGRRGTRDEVRAFRLASFDKHQAERA